MTDLKFLVAKLNRISRIAAEKGATFAVARGNSEVDIEHLFLGLLDVPRSDAALVFQHFNIDTDRLTRDLNAALDRHNSGNVRTPILSAGLVKLFSAAWNLASAEFEIPEIRSAIVLLAFIEGGAAAQLAGNTSAEFLKFNGARFRQNMASLFSVEEGVYKEHQPARNADTESALSAYTVDLTAAARAGAIDPVFGRESEIRQVIDILTRRRQNNPILIGEPGVGKTAIAEGFALRVAAGDVPPSLAKVALRTLDFGLLLAGASMRGEFENRLKSVMNEVQTSPEPVILFIDEAHTLIGGNGETNAANLLKPALARGDLRTIAATTYAEYRKYFEKDAALARRFQIVAVEEPTEDRAIEMLRRLAPLMERHHGVRLQREAVEAAVRLSHRYVTGRRLPDKAIGVLDTACSRVAMAQNSTPSAIEDSQHRISVLEGELESVERERLTGGDVEPLLKHLFDELAVAETQLADLEDRCRAERELVREIARLRADLEKLGDSEDAAALRLQLAEANANLAAAQGDAPLVPALVDSRVVAEVISDSTGIPVGRMLKSEIHTVLNLRNLLAERVVGQTQALDAIAKRIVSSRAGLEDPCRPTGVFLLAGPSGVGKTETALALADLLYGGERNAVILNMSEYQEAYSISGLKGSPPGYAGYGEGGVLTEAVRRRPYCVLLLDEIEKAHPDVLELFYQVFDKGVMEDSQGRSVDFRNSLILMTSNAGAEIIQRMGSGNPALAPDPWEMLMEELRRVFKPALLARMVVVPYYPIGDTVLHQIVELKLAKVQRRLQESHGVELLYSDQLVEEVVKRCVDAESGARNVDHILTGTLIPELSERILCATVDRKPIQTISMDASPAGAFRYKVE
ncbi:MAG TPA: type VI secretion system ATPase TssH [Bryobacteraceae bacterium]|nr:type VI secretion system ATPase TssH [Bryobacteraceae bacterium]